MNEVSVVPQLSVLPIESGAEGDVETLEEKLVPVEEEQLPQGVADLVAAMLWRQRPLTAMLRGETLQGRAPDQGAGERLLQEPRTQPVALEQLLTLQRLHLAVSQVDRRVMPAPKPEVAMPAPPPIEVRATLNEPVSADLPLPPSEPAIPDRPIESPSKTLPFAHGLSNTPSVVLPATAPVPVPVHRAAPVPGPASLPLPLPLPNIAQEKAPPPNRDFLQVPFHKGTTNGQVTITRLPGESVQNLVLSPSSAQVFEHLREPFEQVRNAHWQLNDNPNQQQHQGSHPSPDDDQEEPSETLP